MYNIQQHCPLSKIFSMKKYPFRPKLQFMPIYNLHEDVFSLSLIIAIRISLPANSDAWINKSGLQSGTIEPSAK